MKNSLCFFIGIYLLVLLTFSACGPQSSEAEMKQAQEAMEKAKIAFAPELARADWDDAMQAWEQGQTAVKEGKSAKTFFVRARARFEKTERIAAASGKRLSGEIAEMQERIVERLSTLRDTLYRGKVDSRVRNQVDQLVGQVEAEAPSVNSLLGEGKFVEATRLARDLQGRLYKAELLIAGK